MLLGILFFFIFVVVENAGKNITEIGLLSKQLALFEKNIQLATDKEKILLSLNFLNQISQKNSSTSRSLLSFYASTLEIRQTATQQTIIQKILAPTLKKFIENYLKNYIQEDNENIYAVLKAYLMLNTSIPYDAHFIANIFDYLLSFETKQNSTMPYLELLTNILTTHKIKLVGDEILIKKIRIFFNTMPSLKLAYLILENKNNYLFPSKIEGNIQSPFFLNYTFSLMYTNQAFFNIISQEAEDAIIEISKGNDVLGIKNSSLSSETQTALVDQLRTLYVERYINKWENLIAHIFLQTPQSLKQIDQIILVLLNQHSPLLNLLQLLNENTYFEPITLVSLKLNRIGSLLNNNDLEKKKLYNIFSALSALHYYLLPILNATDEKQAAYYALSQQLRKHNTIDVLTRLRLVAQETPAPFNRLLEEIANHAGRFLMQDANQFMDISEGKNKPLLAFNH